MKKLWPLWLALTLLLTGCSGDTVIYQVEGGDSDASESQPQPTPPPAGEALKTGLAFVTDTTASRSAEKAVYDMTVVALTVDDDGVIRDCRIDGVGTELPFDTTGTVTGSINDELLTRRELDRDYVSEDDDADEWYDEAEDLAQEAVGKTAAELRLAAEEDWPEPWLSAVEEAAARARHLGAREGEELRLALTADLSGSASATGSEPGRARLSGNAVALTLEGETITSCRIDSVQADVTFDAMGTITGELSTDVKTKTELEEDYGMKAYGGAKYEWYEQAEHFARYVTGKTVQQVLDIPVNGGKPANADLYTSVTISITPFQTLIARAWQQRAAA